MKVSIENYRNYFGPYQLCDKLFFFLSEDRRDKIADWLPVYPFELYHKWFKNRYISVKIDKWDTWSADHTLSLIIHPLLVEYRKNVNGWPMNIDSADVPDHIWKEELDRDEISKKKWEWILDEMIWAFGQIVDNDKEIENVDWSEDFEKVKAHERRKSKALTLFGKYFQNLWN